VKEGVLQGYLAANLRRIRLERGMSQEALAHQLELHRTYIGGIEQKRRNLTLTAVERLADRLGVDPLELLVPDGSPAGPPSSG
jgi:transcriptional regulator with XRE-family HTH domain